MEQHAVLTAIGADRPGLVEEVSEFVLEYGGTIGDSRMANLHGQFAIMMSIGGTAETLDRLRSGLDSLGSRTRLHLQLTAVSPTGVQPPRLPFRLSGRALDQPGLVHVVANVLRSFDANIESMDTTLEAAPITGAPVFSMDLTVAVPVETSVPRLREELARVCDPLNIDWHLTAL